MKKKIILPVLIIAFASVAAWALINARPEVATAPVEPPALLVDVIQAKRNPVTFSVRSQGSVAPRTQTTLVAEASGLIVEVSTAFVSGGFFRKDDVFCIGASARVPPSPEQKPNWLWLRQVICSAIILPRRRR